MYPPYTQYPQSYQQPQYQQPQYQQYQQPKPGFNVVPVSSLEEARAVQTDFGGGITVMPCLAQGIIFTKQLDFGTGSSVLAMYRRVDNAQSEYVTRGEFESFRQELAGMMQKGANENV